MAERDLVAVQSAMVGALQRTASLVEDRAFAPLASELFRGSDRLSPVQQIEVYREQFWLRHVANLEEDFPVAVFLMGKDGFADLVRAYLAAYPPRHYDLRLLGKDLPAFATTHPACRDDVLLLESMRIDWAFMRAYDAPEVAPLDAAKIASAPEVAWPRAKLHFHPSMTILSFVYPVHELRTAIRLEQNPERPEPRESFVVVFRGPEFLCNCAVDALAYSLLTKLVAGEELQVACESVAAIAGIAASDLEAKIGEWFQAWTANGWVVDATFATS